MVNEIPGSEPLPASQFRLTDAQWEAVKARHSAEDERLSSYSGEILVHVRGSQRLYKAGETIHLGPDHVETTVTATADDGTPLAAFPVTEFDGGDIKLVHPGPPPLTLSLSGGRARVQREVTTADLALFDTSNWLRCHWLVALFLAAGWMIIGAQVTLIEALHDSFERSSYANAVDVYLLGTILGAILFGWLPDRFGRRPVYIATAGIYVLTAFLTAFATVLSSTDNIFLVLRLLVGIATGIEYVALNTTVQELMPKKRRGWACLAINGAFWPGYLIVAILVGSTLPGQQHWTTIFLIVGALGGVLLVLRLAMPESPRFLAAHYRKNRWTERMLEQIRADLEKRPRRPALQSQRMLVPAKIPGLSFARIMWNHYRRQTLVCLALICAQAAYFNIAFFRSGFMMEDFYSSAESPISKDYMVLIALANFAGPVLLGWLFDVQSIGRQWMISVTYVTSGVMLLGIAFFLWLGYLPLSPWEMAWAWAFVFFIASAAASSAYLTLGESFPAEIRASAFALLFGIGMASGLVGSVIYDWLPLGSGEITFQSFSLAAALAMIGAGAIERYLGVEYAGLALEEKAPALSRAPTDDGVPIAPVRSVL